MECFKCQSECCTGITVVRLFGESRVFYHCCSSLRRVSCVVTLLFVSSASLREGEAEMKQGPRGGSWGAAEHGQAQGLGLIKNRFYERKENFSFDATSVARAPIRYWKAVKTIVSWR